MVTFQSPGQEDKFWRGWFSETDTEDQIIQRAKRAMQGFGTWRRLGFWADHDEIRIIMMNACREVTMRYTENDEPEEKKIQICWEDTPKRVLERLGHKTGWFMVDAAGCRFPDNDALYAFFSSPGSRALNIRHGVSLMRRKFVRPPNQRT
jgi:hypothetical protein